MSESSYSSRSGVRRLGARTDHVPPALLDASIALWGGWLRADPQDGGWADQDRIVLASPGLAARVGVSPEGVVLDLSRAPPGHGVGTAAGLALAETLLVRRFGRSLVDHRTWVLCDGADLETGVALEAAALATRHRLARLCVIASPTNDTPATARRFAAMGWQVRQASPEGTGTPATMLMQVLATTMRARRPTLILCAEDDTGGDALADARSDRRQSVAIRGRGMRKAWAKRLFRHPLRASFVRQVEKPEPPPLWEADWGRLWHGHELAASTPFEAASNALTMLAQIRPEIIGLTLGPLEDTPDEVSMIACGPRAQGMSALLNGLAHHGGHLPVGFVSSLSIDRLRPALRLASILGWQVVHCLRDESGRLDAHEIDWLPVEQLASLRAMPNVYLFRPGDGLETRYALEAALARKDGPSVLVLDDLVRATPSPSRLIANGAYLRRVPNGPRAATLIASGAEIVVADALASRLARAGYPVAVVSLPCWKLFAEADAVYQAEILGDAPRIAIERASAFGWERWIGNDGLFLGPQALAEGHDGLLGRVLMHLAP